MLDIMKRFILPFLFCILSNSFYVQAQIVNVSDYQTIQQAIDAAPPGATVLIPAGEFYTHLVVTKPLTLQGAGSDKTILYFMDESMRQNHHRDIMDFTDYALPVIRIEQASQVSIQDLELRGATEGFTHFGYSNLGIVSKSTSLVLQNVVIRRFKNIYVWVDRGRLQADQVTFADNQGFAMQGDLGFHLTNVEEVVIENFLQETDQVDHAINFNDVPYGEEIERTTRALIKDSSILASSLYWGDCIRTYGGTDIVVRNTLFTRKINAEAPRDLANSGLSMNGNRVSLLVDNCRFENLPDAVVFYTNRYGDQHYEVSIQNSTFSNSSRAYFLFAGEGSLELDLGGGPLSSTGGNIFDPLSDMLWVKNEVNAVVYAPLPLAEDFRPFSQNEQETVLRESFSFRDNRMERTDPQGHQYSYTFQNLTLINALDLGTFVLAFYRNSGGTDYLGRFSPQLEYWNEYQFGNAKIQDLRANSSFIIVRYLDNGYEHVGTFDTNLNFLGSYWFHERVSIVDFGIQQDQIFVSYDYKTGESVKRYTAIFDRKMKFITLEEE